MIKMQRTGTGTAVADKVVNDATGTGFLPIQARGDGATQFRVLGRVAEEADWIEVIPVGTASFLQSIAWCPHLALEITSGTGAVTIWVGEK